MDLRGNYLFMLFINWLFSNCPFNFSSYFAFIILSQRVLIDIVDYILPYNLCHNLGDVMDRILELFLKEFILYS